MQTLANVRTIRMIMGLLAILGHSIVFLFGFKASQVFDALEITDCRGFSTIHGSNLARTLIEIVISVSC